MNNELESIWKETVLILFKVLSRYLSGGSEGSRKTLSQYSGFPGLDLNSGPTEYEVVLLIGKPDRK
jgi:hypothetical protein